MRKFGLIGFPLGHSFSKKYFADKFSAEHITDCTYENFPMENLNGFMEFVSSDPELEGLNITIPYKSEIIRFLNNIDPEAAEIGAVNVVKIRNHTGKLILSGFNSDVDGIRDTIRPFVRDNVSSALVLGTGGSSRAVCFVLEKLGLKVIRVSRERKPGVITYSDIDDKLIDQTRLIVNTTPLGMFPNIDTKPEINYKRLGKSHILFDLVYNPEQTVFLRLGSEQGCIALSGISMLHSQAEKAWDIWNDVNV